MKLIPFLVAGIAVSALTAASCNDKADDGAAMGKPKDFKFIDRANMDTSVSPADNFFLYANGTWLKQTEIPGDQTRWGSFNELREHTLDDLHALLEDAAKNTDSDNAKEVIAGNFYKSGMDTAQIEKAGIAPIKPVLDRIAAINSPEGILAEVAKEHTQGIGQLYGFYVGIDDKNVTKEISQFYQGGLGLSTRDDYFAKDSRSEEIRKAYLAYVADMLQAMGRDKATAEKSAAAIFELEKALAFASLRPVEMRNPQKLYNKYDLNSLNGLTPSIDWTTLLPQMNIKGEDTVIVATPDFFKELSKQLKATPLDVWKEYLAFHVVSDMAPYLSSEFSDLRFNFYGTVLSGQKEQQPRWKRVVHVINGAVGEALGQLYVDKHFRPEAKKRMMELVGNLQKAFHERIENLDWMSDVTKQKAIAKLNTFIKKIGYPDKWKDYSSVKIVADNYVQNVLNAYEFQYNYNISKLGKPVDKTEWQMTPQTVNAYYNPGFNEIVFPAAILQFPFFDFNADDAVNYGGIGAVIGHEMTHGFDDQGAQYDAEGYLKNWWTPEDSAQFAAKTNVVREQFDQYTVLDSVHVNGSLTLGENIADLGGVTIAYQAFKKTKQGQSNEKINGFTPDQRFFLSWAQVWRGKSTPERARQLIKIDPHSPEMWRCNGPLSNFEPFYKAFNVKEGDGMWRADSIRAKVW